MMILGTGDNAFIFQTNTLLPQKYSRNRDQKISTNTRIGQQDKLQHLGPGKDTFSLQGSIFPSSNLGTLTSLNALNELAMTGQAQRLIMGDELFGDIIGKFMISNISEGHEYFDKQYNARRIDFSFKLSRQG